MSFELKNVTVSYGEHVVLDQISLKAEDNETLYILGDSGTGKITLLRVIAGLETLREGSVKRSGNKLSVVFQEPRLFPTQTVLENMESVRTREDADRDTKELLRLLDLTEAKDLYPQELSGGMQKRAAIARALSVHADIYVFDEPTGGQDKAHTEQIAAAIKTYTAGKTVLIATHDEYLQTLVNGNKLFILDAKCTRI